MSLSHKYSPWWLKALWLPHVGAINHKTVQLNVYRSFYTFKIADMLLRCSCQTITRKFLWISNWLNAELILDNFSNVTVVLCGELVHIIQKRCFSCTFLSFLAYFYPLCIQDAAYKAIKLSKIGAANRRNVVHRCALVCRLLSTPRNLVASELQLVSSRCPSVYNWRLKI